MHKTNHLWWIKMFIYWKRYTDYWPCWWRGHWRTGRSALFPAAPGTIRGLPVYPRPAADAAHLHSSPHQSPRFDAECWCRSCAIRNFISRQNSAKPNASRNDRLARIYEAKHSAPQYRLSLTEGKPFSLTNTIRKYIYCVFLLYQQ